MLAICVVTCSVAPLPRVTIVITEATPMTIPSTVRKDRRTFRRISLRARRSVFQNISGPPHCAGRTRSGRP